MGAQIRVEDRVEVRRRLEQARRQCAPAERARVQRGDHRRFDLPGVMAGLQQWQGRGLQLACLTNKPLDFARPLLKAKGLDVFFAQVFGGDSFERKKPDPLPLLKTCEALGVKPEQALMVGDSSNDAQAARAAGCPVVLVRYGYNHGEPVDGVDADAHVDTLTHIAQALAGKA